MNLQSLGYVGLRTRNLEDWEHYCTRLLGMQLVDKTSASLALRMDDRKNTEIPVSRSQTRRLREYLKL